MCFMEERTVWVNYCFGTKSLLCIFCTFLLTFSWPNQNISITVLLVLQSDLLQIPKQQYSDSSETGGGQIVEFHTIIQVVISA